MCVVSSAFSALTPPPPPSRSHGDTRDDLSEHPKLRALQNSTGVLDPATLGRMFRWYHGDLSRQACETILAGYSSVSQGRFLVRNQTGANVAGLCVVSACFLLRRSGDLFAC